MLGSTEITCDRAPEIDKWLTTVRPNSDTVTSNFLLVKQLRKDMDMVQDDFFSLRASTENILVLISNRYSQYAFCLAGKK